MVYIQEVNVLDLGEFCLFFWAFGYRQAERRRELQESTSRVLFLPRRRTISGKIQSQEEIVQMVNAPSRHIMPSFWHRAH